MGPARNPGEHRQDEEHQGHERCAPSPRDRQGADGEDDGDEGASRERQQRHPSSVDPCQGERALREPEDHRGAHERDHRGHGAQHANGPDRNDVRMTGILHGPTSRSYYAARHVDRRCRGGGPRARDCDDVAAGARHEQPGPIDGRRRRVVQRVERRVGRARARHQTPRDSTTPTSSTRTRSRWRSQKPTSAPASSRCRRG